MIYSSESLNSNPSPADIVESFYLETHEGLYFAVKGLEHPPDRWIAVLRYAPDRDRGDRMRGGISYRRLYHFDEQERLIRTAFPQYLAYDSMFQTTLQSVPRSAVVRIHDPRRRYQELLSEPDLPPIEDDARALLRLLQAEAQVPAPALGITGSLLTGLYTEHSDLDVAAFGTQECRKVYEALRRLLETRKHPELRPLNSREMEELYAQRVVDTRMPFDEFVRLERRKVNQGTFRGRPYFIRFIKHASEAGTRYGNLTYTPLGKARVFATIADDQDAIFTPCRYSLTKVSILEGRQVANLIEVISFRGRFCEQACAGESVCAAGTLECLENKHGEQHYRLLLGNHPDDTLESSRR